MAWEPTLRYLVLKLVGRVLLGFRRRADEYGKEAFRALLPSHFSYSFFDGEHDCPAADGVDGIYPAPYLCFYPVPTTGNVADAHGLVWDLIEEEGPFDAVMGFSQVCLARPPSISAGYCFPDIGTDRGDFLQGGALAASFILHHQITHPFAPPPFRLAIFICASLPYSVNEKHGVDAAGLFVSPSNKPGVFRWKTYEPTADDGSARPRPLHKTHETVPQAHGEKLSHEPADSGYQSAASGSDSESGEKRTGHDPVIKRFHPAVDKHRIAIPTAHIYGRQDPYYNQSLDLIKLCENKWVSTYEHLEGHNVPRASSVTKGIVDAIEKAVRASEFAV
jgi:hypothetical protein